MGVGFKFLQVLNLCCYSYTFFFWGVNCSFFLVFKNLRGILAAIDVISDHVVVGVSFTCLSLLIHLLSSALSCADPYIPVCISSFTFLDWFYKYKFLT